MKITVNLPDGQTIEAEGESMPFVALEEPWLIYELRNGVRLSIRPILTKVVRIARADGTFTYVPALQFITQADRKDEAVGMEGLEDWERASGSA